MSTDYLTPDDVATHLQVSRQVVYNWINDGRLRAVKAGRTLRIPHYALEAFLQPVQAGDISAGSLEPDNGYRIDQFTTSAQEAFAEANSQVRTRQHLQLDVEHVLWALVQQPDGIAQKVLKHLGVDPHPVTQQLEQTLAQLPADPALQHSPHTLAVSTRIGAVIKRAEELSSQLPELQIDAAHVLQAICEETQGTGPQLLHAAGITLERLRVALIDLRTSTPAPHQASHSRSEWELRIEQQLTRIETELGTIRSLLTQQNES